MSSENGQEGNSPTSPPPRLISRPSYSHMGDVAPAGLPMSAFRKMYPVANRHPRLKLPTTRISSPAPARGRG